MQPRHLFLTSVLCTSSLMYFLTTEIKMSRPPITPPPFPATNIPMKQNMISATSVV